MTISRPNTGKQTTGSGKAKKVTAPKTYKPSGGRPLEHLAYLNEREMAYLRSLNGDNVERGPKGIMSFADDSASSKGVSRGGQGAVGSGSTRTSNGSVSKSSPSSSRSTGSGNRSGVGGGGGGGGGSTGSRGSSTGNVRSSNGSNAAGNTGRTTGGGNKGNNPTGGSLSAPARTAPSSSRPSSTGSGNKGNNPTGGPLSAPNRTAASYSKPPASPMGGQGSSFSSPVFAQNSNRDKIDQQKAQTKDARTAVNASPAVRADLASGGVKSLNVGPMGTRVNLGAQKMSPLAPAQQSWADSIYSGASSLAGSISDAAVAAASGIGSYFGGTPGKSGGPLGEEAYSRVPQSEAMVTPKYGGYMGSDAYSRVPQTVAPTVQSPIGQDAIDRLKEQYSQYRGTYGASPAAPQGVYGPRVASGTPRTPGYLGAGSQPGMIDSGMPSGYSGKVRDTSIAQDPSIAGRMAQAEANYRYDTAPGLGGGAARVYADPDVPRSRSLGDMVNDAAAAAYDSVFGANKSQSIAQDASLAGRAARAAKEKILEVESWPPGSAIGKMADRLPVDESWPGNTFNIENNTVGIAPTRQAVGTFTDPYNPPTKPFSQFGSEDIPRQYAERYGIGAAETVPRDENGDPTETPDQDNLGPEQNYPKPVSPDDIAEIERQEKINKRGVGVMVKPIPGLINKGLKILTGKDIKDTITEAATDKKYKYLQSSPEQQADMRAKDPSLRRFAVSIGQIPPSAQSQAGSGALFPDVGGRGEGQGIATLGPNGSSNQTRPQPEQSENPSPSAAEARPEIYFMWDVGVNIPSPGDANYTLYLKYLAERAAAKAALGIT